MLLAGALAVRRKRLLEVGGFDESVYTNDWDCWIRLVFSGSRAGLVDEPLLRYRLHEGAQSSNPARMARGQAETLAVAASTIGWRMPAYGAGQFTCKATTGHRARGPPSLC